MNQVPSKLKSEHPCCSRKPKLNQQKPSQKSKTTPVVHGNQHQTNQSLTKKGKQTIDPYCSSENKFRISSRAWKVEWRCKSEQLANPYRFWLGHNCYTNVEWCTCVFKREKIRTMIRTRRSPGAWKKTAHTHMYTIVRNTVLKMRLLLVLFLFFFVVAKADNFIEAQGR